MQTFASSSRATGILAKADASGDLRTALTAIRELRGTIELLARLAGELREATQVNVLVTSEYQELRSLIVRTLGTYLRLALRSRLR